jgi:hypothetical protein
MIHDFYSYHFGYLEGKSKEELLEKIEKFGTWLKMVNDKQENTDPVVFDKSESSSVKPYEIVVNSEEIVKDLYELIAKFEDAPLEKSLTPTFNKIHDQRELIEPSYYIDLINRLMITCTLADIAFPYHRNVRKYTETFKQG